MTCSRCQNEMLGWFGRREWPQELQRHLAACPTCQAAWEELSYLQGMLGTDEIFHPDDREVEPLVSRINNVIERVGQDRRLAVTWATRVWQTYVPVAAAAVLVLGMAAGSYMAGRIAFERKGDSSAVNESGATDLYSETNSELDEGAVGTLIYEFTVQHSYEASEWLLDDLTDEELKFLEESFNVGDLL